MADLLSLKAYVPARKFDQSRRFYAALGFTESPGWGGTADFTCDGHTFRLQNFYVRDWAENFMLVMDVADVATWHARARAMLGSDRFVGMRIQGPMPVGDATVLHIWDPSGVLLILVQSPA